MHHITAIARDAGIREFVAEVLFDNGPCSPCSSTAG